MINYYCPDFVFGQTIYNKIFFLQNNYPEIFYDNVKIKKIFGNFPNVLWNGGGLIFGEHYSLIQIEELFQFYKDMGIILQLTFTNSLIEEIHCYDTYSNKILELAVQFENEILVASPVLEKYIRNKYPEAKIIKSIVSTEKNEDYLSLINSYHNIVFPRRLVKNFDFLESIPIEYRNKFELLCNDPCPIDCKRLYEHYKDYAEITLYQKKHDEVVVECTAFKQGDVLRKGRYKQDQINYEEIVSKYLPLGYTEFKISGRGDALQVATAIIPFLIKPEYQLYILEYLIR